GMLHRPRLGVDQMALDVPQAVASAIAANFDRAQVDLVALGGWGQRHDAPRRGGGAKYIVTGERAARRGRNMRKISGLLAVAGIVAGLGAGLAAGPARAQALMHR